MLTKKLADTIEITLSAFSEYNASLEEDAAPSKLNEDFIESKLCRFDKEIFLELGQDIRKLAVDPCQKSRFLRHHTLYCCDSQHHTRYYRNARPV
jgi:hypothetical protein